ncbi:MAG: BatD family protein [Candidatus Omnitrophica bacterium]|nr:BatD family protein [Candidatus Omnitrophota bacterium]
MKRIAAVVYFIFVFQASVAAKDINIEAALDKTSVSPGRQASLSITCYETADMPAPELPFIKGLVFKYIKSLKRIITVKGQERNAVTHIYRVVPLEERTFTIGPLVFEYGGDKYITKEILLRVTKKPSAPSGKKRATRKKFEISKSIYIKMDIPKRTIFMNEKIPVTLNLISDWLDLEDIIISEFSSAHLISKEFSKGTVEIIDEDGVNYAVLKYDTWFFAVETGAFMIEPISVKFNIARRREKTSGGEPDILNDNEKFYKEFIGAADSRSMKLETEPFKINVLPLPTKNMPESFKGAVGSFTFDAEVHPKKIRLGETVTLTMKIGGSGNFTMLSVPEISGLEGAEIYDPMVMRKDESAVFTQVIKAESSKFSSIPGIIFSYFNPDKKEYVSVSKGPFIIDLIDGEKVKAADEERESTQTLDRDENIIKDTIGIKDSSGRLRRINSYFYRNPGFIALQSIPIIVFFAAFAVYRRKLFMLNNPEYARRLRALKKARINIRKTEFLMKHGAPEKFYEMLFRTIQEYLGTRLFLPAEGVAGEVVDVMSVEGGDTTRIKEKIKNIFSDTYLSKYTTVKMEKSDMEAILKNIKETIDFLDTKESLRAG